MGNGQTENRDEPIELTLEELSARTGEPVERLAEWQSLGLIGAANRDDFAPEDVERVRLVQMGLRRGVPLEAIAHAFKEGQLDWHVAALARPGPTRSLAEAAEMFGLEPAVLRRFWDSAGFGELAERVWDEDLETVRSLKIALQAGFPEEALTQLVRVIGEGLSKIAEAEARLFRFYLIRQLKKQGVTGERLLEAIGTVNAQTLPLIEPALLYFHRRAQERAARDDAALVMAQRAGLLQETGPPGQMAAAIAFVDLSSFTPLTEAMGDAKAAEVLERFSALVRESASRWDGRVVKQIGDAFMLVFPDARSAVACALEIERLAAEEPQFPALRVGVQSGPVLYREGDYLGSNVNIASRLASEAKRHQVLLTAAARKEAGSLPGVEFVRLGKRRLKGLAEELVLFEARSSFAPDSEKAIDPVCGMELGPAEVAASLSLAGEERAFCSEECLRRFVASPERYSA